jgi:hypothetical protein
MRRAVTVSLLVLSVFALAAVDGWATGSAPDRAPGVARNYGGWCEARLTAAWTRVLSAHIVPLSRGTSLVSFALAPDGRSFFADVHSPGFSGVAQIGTTESAMTKIKAFPDPNNDQANGSYDGRWLVWKEYHGFWTFRRLHRLRLGLAHRPGDADRCGGEGAQRPLLGEPLARPGRTQGDRDLGAGKPARRADQDPCLRPVHRQGRVIHTGHTEGPSCSTTDSSPGRSRLHQAHESGCTSPEH